MHAVPEPSQAQGATLGLHTGDRTAFVPRVFVSHNAADDAEWGARLVGDLRAALGGDPSTVWYDTRGLLDLQQGRIGGMQAGVNWPDEIAREIAERNVFVVLLSPSSVEAPWVREEIRLAWIKRNAAPQAGEQEPPAYVIVPVLLRPCKVPPPLNLIQYVSFLPGKAYDEAFVELVAAIRLGSTRLLPFETDYGPPFDLSLVPQPDHFVGRREDMEWLLARLRAGGATAITAVRGTGGIGKTALASMAVHLAYGEGMFPDGIGVVLCQDRSDWMGVLRDVLTRFDPNRKQPDARDEAGLSDAARRLLTNKRALVVLDNIEPTLDVGKVVAPLKVLGITVLLTARQVLPDTVVPSTGSRMLDLLSTEEALDLFAHQLGCERTAQLGGSLRASERIVHALDRHTLAVKLAGAYAAGTHRDLETLATELEHDPLVVPDGETPRGLALALGRSIAALDDNARRLFQALPVFATNEFGRAAVTALGEGLGLTDASAPINLLVLRALLDAATNAAMPAGTDRERLRMHPLLRACAEQAYAEMPEAERDRLYLTVAQHYARYTTSVHRDVVPPDERDIEGALEWALAHQQDEVVARICVGMLDFWRDYGRKTARQSYLPLGQEAAERLTRARRVADAPVLLAWLKLGNAQFLRLQGRVREARRVSGGILRAFRHMKQLRGEGSTLVLLANIARDQSKPDLAEEYLNQAYHIFTDPRVADTANAALALAFRGQIRERTGRRNAEADQDLATAIELYERLNNEWGRELASQLRARIALRRGLLSDAEKTYAEALTIHRRLQSRRAEGVDLSALGQIAYGRGQYERAHLLYTQSLTIRRESGDRRGEAVDLTMLGRLACTRADYDVAARNLADALAIWRAMGETRGIGWVTSEMGQVALAQQNARLALQRLHTALRLHRKAEDAPAEAATLAALGEAHLLRGRVRRAQYAFGRALRLAKIVEDPLAEGKALRGLAMCAEHRRDMQRAQALLEESLSLAQQGESPLARADALAALGEFYTRSQPGAPRGAELLEQAHRTYRSLGLQSSLDLPDT